MLVQKAVNCRVTLLMAITLHIPENSLSETMVQVCGALLALFYDFFEWELQNAAHLKIPQWGSLEVH